MLFKIILINMIVLSVSSSNDDICTAENNCSESSDVSKTLYTEGACINFNWNLELLSWKCLKSFLPFFFSLFKNRMQF